MPALAHPSLDSHGLHVVPLSRAPSTDVHVADRRLLKRPGAALQHQLHACPHATNHARRRVATQNPSNPGERPPHAKMWAGVAIALYGHTDARGVSRRTRPRLRELERKAFAVTLVVAFLRSEAESTADAGQRSVGE